MKKSVKTNPMTSKLYYYAYKFLKYRAIGKNAIEVFANLTTIEKDKVITFLKFNHQVKFI